MQCVIDGKFIDAGEAERDEVEAHRSVPVPSRRRTTRCAIRKAILQLWEIRSGRPAARR